MALQLEKLQKEYHNHVIPDTLLKLIDFDAAINDNYYFTESFELTYRSYWDRALEVTSVRRPFFKAIIPFAQATSSGSFYAFWVKEPTQSLDQAPIVFFGDEGGIYIVANNLEELLQIICIDAEPMTYDESVVYIPEEYDEDEAEDFISKHIDTYKAWVKSTFNREPLNRNEIDVLVKKAQQNHQNDFNNWFDPLKN